MEVNTRGPTFGEAGYFYNVSQSQSKKGQVTLSTSPRAISIYDLNHFADVNEMIRPESFLLSVSSGSEQHLMPSLNRQDVEVAGFYTYTTRIDWRLSVHKKLTITVDQEVYEALHKTIGPRRISKFVEDLVRPHVIPSSLALSYCQMAQDGEREAEALEWAELTFKDCTDEER